jgi:hypothetical protein
LLIVIHGQSFFISQFLQATSLEINGITAKPIMLNEIVKISNSFVKRVINKYTAMLIGTNQFGKTITIFCLNTFLKDLSFFFLKNLEEIAPYPHGHAEVL